MNPIIRTDATGALPGTIEKSSKDKQTLKKACQDFEAILVGKLMKEVFLVVFKLALKAQAVAVRGKIQVHGVHAV